MTTIQSEHEHEHEHEHSSPHVHDGATHLLLVLAVLPDAAPARKELHLAAVPDGVQELQHVEPAKYHNHIR